MSKKPDAKAKPAKKAAGRAAPKQAGLNAAGTTAIVELIIEGKSYREIAKQYGVSLATLAFWIEAETERSHACARAREMSAQTFDERALEAISNAKDGFELSRAKEEAIHLRWRAKAVNPKRYGDKVAVDNTVTVRDVTDEALLAELAKYGVPIPAMSQGEAVH